MDKKEFLELSARIDARVEAMGPEGALHMVRMFEMLSASFAREDKRPSLLLHGVGKNLLILSVNVEALDILDTLACAYTAMHDKIIGKKPAPGELH
jgi:hypothetical protein